VSGGVGVDPSVAVAAVAAVASASAFVPAYTSSDVYACAYVPAQIKTQILSSRTQILANTHFADSSNLYFQLYFMVANKVGNTSTSVKGCGIMFGVV
jgi:hypothetical protein